MSDSLDKKFNTPTIFVIFGATGDLAKRKLFPALFDLFHKELLPDQFRIIGFAHSDRTTESLREYVKEIVACEDEGCVEEFINRISYVRGSFDDANGFRALAGALKEIDDDIGQCSNKLFHLAIPPYFYEDTLQRLADSGLTEPCDDELGWTRVLIEKPFGRDLETARELDAQLAELFREEQIYRIDHYLAKETVQNIMMFRFANAVFAPAWNDRYIEEISVEISEDIDADERGAFYDDIGALRDVGQNHAMQLLAAVTMEEPATFSASDIRLARANVLDRLTFDPSSAVRGQYEGFLDADGVREGSETETFFRITGMIDTERWKETRFSVIAGKALDKKCVRLTVTFREPEKCLCATDKHDQKNQIIIDIQPEERITVKFFAKEHGFGNQITQKNLDFSFHSDATSMEEIDAYERVLHDAVIGDQVLFASTEEVASAWKAMMPVLDGWRGSDLITYQKGIAAENIK